MSHLKLKTQVEYQSGSFNSLSAKTHHVVLPSKNSVVDVESAELLLVDAHQVIDLGFDQPLLDVVPRQRGQVTVADVQGLKRFRLNG